MRNALFALFLILVAVSCKKEDKYLVLPQSAALYYSDTGRGPDARNYSLVLKSTPGFISFDSPVPYPDGHYEFTVANPFHIDPGSTSLFLYDSLNRTVDQFTVTIPAPQASKESIEKKVSFTGSKYMGEITIMYSPAK